MAISKRNTPLFDIDRDGNDVVVTITDCNVVRSYSFEVEYNNGSVTMPSRMMHNVANDQGEFFLHAVEVDVPVWMCAVEEELVSRYEEQCRMQDY